MYAYPILSEKSINGDKHLLSIQGPCGNSTYQPLSPTNTYECASLISRISDEQLIVEERYSTISGCFGTVRDDRPSFSLSAHAPYIFQIVRGYIYLRHPYDVLKPILIKALTTHDSIQKYSSSPSIERVRHTLLPSREVFDKEHEIMARLNHPNLVQFFGYTTKQNYALIEHSDLGDLHTFLSTTRCLQQDQVSLSYVPATCIAKAHPRLPF